MQAKDTLNHPLLTAISLPPPSGRIIAFDPGTRKWGVAVSDPGQHIASPVDSLLSTNWKKLLKSIQTLIGDYDAVAVVVGLPLESSGKCGPMADYVLQKVEKLKRSINIPVYLQDERVTTYEARSRIWLRGGKPDIDHHETDPEAAAVILGDFLDRLTSARK
jgi:putative Holliday junction resolvase